MYVHYLLPSSVPSIHVHLSHPTQRPVPLLPPATLRCLTRSSSLRLFCIHAYRTDPFVALVALWSLSSALELPHCLVRTRYSTALSSETCQSLTSAEIARNRNLARHLALPSFLSTRPTATNTRPSLPLSPLHMLPGPEGRPRLVVSRLNPKPPFPPRYIPFELVSLHRRRPRPNPSPLFLPPPAPSTPITTPTQRPSRPAPIPPHISKHTPQRRQTPRRCLVSRVSSNSTAPAPAAAGPPTVNPSNHI